MVVFVKFLLSSNFQHLFLNPLNQKKIAPVSYYLICPSAYQHICLLFCWWEWESRSLPCVLKSPPPLFKNIAQTLLPSVPWIIISLPACNCFSYLEWKKQEKPQTRFKCYFPSNCHYIFLFYFTAEFFVKKCPCSLTLVSLFPLFLEPTAVRLFHLAETALSKVTTDFQWPFLIL